MCKQINILAIDDEPGIIYTFKAVAKLESWNVVGITEPAKGINLAINGDFDIVLLDYHMPDINGLEVLKKIRDKNKDIPIIILTIDERYEISKLLLEAGANDYALKPIKAADLISRIKAHLDKSYQSVNINNFKDYNLPKGLSFVTLKKIYEKMKSIDKYLTLEEISEITGFAYQTVHRYLVFFEEQDLVSKEMEYGSVGRPIKKYKLIIS